MIGWLLDTNVLAEAARPQGSRRVKQWLAEQADRHLFISILVVAEHDKGIANLADDDPRRASLERTRDAVVARFGSRVVGVSDAVVRRWGTISGKIEQKTRQSPPVIDTLLAATAIEHDLCLVTRNLADVALSGATLFNPWTDDPAPAPAGRPRAGPPKTTPS